MTQPTDWYLWGIVDFGLTELQESVRRETLTIATSFGLDYWREHDREAAYPWEFVRAYAAAGWLGVVIPEQYGGAGLGLIEAGLLLHAVGRSGAGTSGASAIHFYIFPITPIVRHGSEYLKQTYLPKAAHRTAKRRAAARWAHPVLRTAGSEGVHYQEDRQAGAGSRRFQRSVH